MSGFRPELPLIAAALAACTTTAPASDDALATIEATLGAATVVEDVTRDHVRDDIWHHAFTLRLGDTANARIRLHRVVREWAPWLPRPTVGGAMLLHGDFASFATNFAPVLADPSSIDGLAVDLAGRGLDIWGLDRRWALAPVDADTSDFGDMGLAQELDDLGLALGAARAIRAATGAGLGRLHLVGFSRGGFLAYAYAAAEGARPAALRHVKGLVPLDTWAVPPPDAVDARAFLCEGAALERQLVADGVVDSDNSFFITIGALARTAPHDASPFFDGLTNRDALLVAVGQTYWFFPPTPHYHLAAPILDGDAVVGLRESPEPVIAGWLEHAAPHQSMREAADTDGAQCGDGQGPTVDLARIRVPLLDLAAAGGYGAATAYSTTLVGSADVTHLLIQRVGPEGAFEDFGHGDLLFATDAPTLVWQPLAAWLAAH